MKKILVFGSLNIDYVYEMPHFVQAGETVSSTALNVYCGGKGLNQSIAFARCHVPVFHAGAIGAADGKLLLEHLQFCGVDTRFIKKKNVSSGHAIIQNTPDGENCILLYGGANQQITKEDADHTLAYFEAGDYIVLQNEINQMPYIMTRAHEKGMIIVFNPSPMDEKIGAMPLDVVDYLLLNEIEASQLCGFNGDIAQLPKLLTGKFPDTKIVLTLGKHGSVYCHKSQCLHQPIYPVTTVDTTAAGDTFTGYFISNIALGVKVAQALDTAAKASAIAVSRPGASPSIPAAEEIDTFFKL